jgi:hypothetical protein
MQTDIESEGSWLTESTHPDQCPLCSKPMALVSSIGLPDYFTCYSCGYGCESVEKSSARDAPSTVENPYSGPPTGSSVWIDPAVYTPSIEASPSAGKRSTRSHQPKLLSQPEKQPHPNTPIPPRASAQHAASRHVGSAPTKQPASSAWEYESDNYAAGGSLPALSLLTSETPTQPQVNSPFSRRETRRLKRIDEIDTTPPLPQSSAQTQSTQHQRPLPAAPTIYDAVTKPPTALILPVAGTRPMVAHASSTDMVEAETASWTAGNSANSPYAQLIANAASRKKKRRTSTLNPLDRVRWWLLHPGRIEFMLWISGTILLIIVTCSFLLLTASSLNWLTPALPGGTASSSAVNTPARAVTESSPAITTTPGLVLTLLDKGPLLAGLPVHLRGQGFSHNGRVVFTYDGTHQFQDQNGQVLIILANAHGTFIVALWPGDTSYWNIGHHTIVAHDLKTNHLATLDIVLSAGPYGKTVPTTPVQVITPGVSPTSVPGGGGVPTPVGPTPVGQTPVPVTPTVIRTPKPAPSPSPTRATPVPTPTSTVGTTPTVTSTPGGKKTPTASSNNSGPSSLGNALSNGSADSSSGFQQAGFNPLVLLIIVCYMFAIVLLGVAGVLHKRRK